MRIAIIIVVGLIAFVLAHIVIIQFARDASEVDETNRRGQYRWLLPLLAVMAAFDLLTRFR
jgi:uncharacterized membrane protein YhhN